MNFCRFDPRLFDEILDWLLVNGKYIDIQRLRSISKTKSPDAQRLAQAAACYVSLNSKTYKRKWEALSKSGKFFGEEPEPLFLTAEGDPYPRPKNISKIFSDYGFLRDEPVSRSLSRPVPVNIRGNIRFLMRSLFGTGSRAECILYLLTNKTGTPSEIAKAAGISVRAVQDALIDLSDSLLVIAVREGKRKILYRVSKERWWKFLSGDEYADEKPPEYLNWLAVFSALEEVFDAVSRAEASKSDYMQSSILRQAAENIKNEFAKSGISLPPAPGAGAGPEEYARKFLDFVSAVLGAE